MPFAWAFHAGFSNLILQMIPWPKLEGNQPKGSLGKALPPFLAITWGLNPLSLLSKQTGGLRP